AAADRHPARHGPDPPRARARSSPARDRAQLDSRPRALAAATGTRAGLPVIEGRHGSAGTPRALGGLGGDLGAPHVLGREERGEDLNIHSAAAVARPAIPPPRAPSGLATARGSLGGTVGCLLVCFTPPGYRGAVAGGGSGDSAPAVG